MERALDMQDGEEEREALLVFLGDHCTSGYRTCLPDISSLNTGALAAAIVLQANPLLL